MPLLQFYRGTDVTFNLTVTDETTGQPVDLSGATVRLKIGELGGTAAVNKVMSITNATAGQASVTVTAAETAGLAGEYMYTIVVTTSANVTFVAAQGPITFVDTVL